MTLTPAADISHCQMSASPSPIPSPRPSTALQHNIAWTAEVKVRGCHCAGVQDTGLLLPHALCDRYNSVTLWIFADRLIDYGTLAIFDLLFWFELLSHFGIHSELNVIAWMLATGVGIPIMLATYFGLMIWSYDRSYAANSADGSDGDILQEMMSKEMRNMIVRWVGFYLALTYNAEEWLLA